MEDNTRRGCSAEPSRLRVRPCPNYQRSSYVRMIKEVGAAYTQRVEALTVREGQGTAASINQDRVDEAIRAELASSTGQSIGRINKLLAQAEHLTDQCLNKLDRSGADEDFFDAAQPTRRLLLKNMVSRGLTNEEIKKENSVAMEQMFEEYERGGKIDRKRWLDRLNRTSKEKPAWAPGRRVFGKPKVLIYRRPNGLSPDLRPPTAEEIADRLKVLAREITQIAEGSHGNDQRLLQDIGRMVIEMAKLHQSVRCLRESTMERTDHGTLH
jgi:hypothetical protein